MIATEADDRIDELLRIRLDRRFSAAEELEYLQLTTMRMRHGGHATR
ncbi:MAG: hypothetical protein QOE35_1619 [Actinomycetota bacterium]|jgi:hypothetical protein